MKIISRQNLANTAADRWESQYGGANWKPEHAQTLVQLRVLGKCPDPDEIDEIIGNRAWTSTGCDECGARNVTVVEIGKDMDYNSYTAHVCLACLKKAVELVESDERQ